MESRTDSHKRQRYLSWALKLTVGAGLLAALAWRDLIDVGLIGRVFQDPLALAALTVYAWLTMSLVALRWAWLLRGQGISVPVSRLYKLLSFSCLAAYAFPGLAGGDVLRMAAGKRLTGGWGGFAFSVLADRLLGMVGLLLVGFGVTLLYVSRLAGDEVLRDWMLLVVFVLALACAAVGVGVACAAGMRRSLEGSPGGGRVRAFLFRAAQTVCEYRRQPGLVLRALGLSVLIHIKDVGLLYFLQHLLTGRADPLAFHALAGAVAFLANTAPVTPGGVGVGEAAYGKAMSLLGSPATLATYAGIMLAFRIVFILGTLPGSAQLFIAGLGGPEDDGKG